MRHFFPSLLKKQQGNDLGGKAASSRWLALALLCIAQFMVVLDVQLVVIALPAIQREFAISQTNLKRGINAYVLIFGGFLMLAGRAPQGLGAACISPAALAQLTSIFPQGPERNRALGWWGAAAPVGGVSGLLLGGLLTPLILPESRAPRTTRLDISGAITGTA